MSGARKCRGKASASIALTVGTAAGSALVGADARRFHVGRSRRARSPTIRVGRSDGRGLSWAIIIPSVCSAWLPPPISMPRLSPERAPLAQGLSDEPPSRQYPFNELGG